MATCRIVPHIDLVKNRIRLIDGIEAAALQIFAGKVAQAEDIDIIRDALLEYMQNKVLSFKNERGA